jgi:Lipid A 3-O-deacylase (PagL)
VSVGLDFAKLPTRVWLTLICVAALVPFEPGITRAEDSIGLCARCDLLIGVGATYRLFGWTDGVVVPLAVRFDLDSHGRLLELGIHHWSNFWIKQPNRGQDFLTLSFGF